MINQIIEFIKSHKKIFGSIVVVLVFLIFYFLSSPTTKVNNNKSDSDQNSSNQTNIKSTTEPFDITDNDSQYPLKSLLPYNGQGFVVDSYIAPLVLLVKVKNKSDISTAEPVLKAWLKGKELFVGQNKITWKYGE